MAASSNIRAGRAYVELGVSDKLTKGLARAMATFKAFGEGMRATGVKLMAIGAGAGGILGGAVKSFASAGDALDEMSARTGMSVEALSELGYVADLAGVGLDGLEGGLRKMQKTIAGADDESKSAVKALAELGMTVEDLAGMSPDEQFAAIAQRLSQISDPASKAAAAMAVFGKSGTALLPMMTEGAEGIDALRQKARDLGLTWSTDSAKGAAKLSDAMDTLWAVAKRVYQVIGEQLAPTVTAVANWMSMAGKKAMEFVRENRALIVTAAKVAVGILASGAALVVLGTTITQTMAILAGVKALFVGAATAVSAIVSIISGLISPLGLAIAAVATFGTATKFGSEQAGQAIRWLMDRFTDLRKWVGEVIAGVSDALAAGDIALAAKVLWAGLKVVWQSGVSELTQIWARGWAGLQKLAAAMGTGILASFEIVTRGLEQLADTAFTTIGMILRTSAAGWQESFTVAFGWIGKQWLRLQSLFDDSFDLDAALKAVDTDVKANVDAIDKGLREANQKAGAAADQERARREKERNDTLAEIGKKYEQVAASADAGSAAKIQQAKDELDAAKRELNTSLAKAREEAAKVQTPEAPGGQKYQDDLADGLMKAKATVSGTFSGIAAGGLGAGGMLGELKKHTNALANIDKNTKQRPMASFV